LLEENCLKIGINGEMNNIYQADLFGSFHYGNPDGNRELVDYGIGNDKSDFRIHVGYKTQHIFVFPTEEGRKALEETSGIRLKNIQIGKITTAQGYPVPISSIKDIQEILIPIDIYKKYQIHQKNDDTSIKGIKAIEISVEMLKRGLIKLPLNISTIGEKDLQIKGQDIIVCSKVIIQVKCDFLAGNKNYGGTGNIFLQIKECNPYKKY